MIFWQNLDYPSQIVELTLDLEEEIRELKEF